MNYSIQEAFEDRQRNHCVIEGYDGSSISTEIGSLYAGSVEELGFQPKAGDVATFWGRGLGFVVRGLAVNGNLIRYESEEEYDTRIDEEQKEEARIQKERWMKEDQPTWESRIEALPPAFQERLNRCRRNNPDFDWDYGPYELMVSEQAYLFAQTFPTIEELVAFQDADWSKQKDMCPGLDEGHSGNTFSCAIFIANTHIREPDRVALIPPAMSPVSGSRAIGWNGPDLSGD